MPIALDKYLRNLPKLHSWDGGATWNTGGFERKHFKSLSRILRPGMKILETGCGNSTLFFLLHNPQQLISIDPFPDIFDRVNEYCVQHSIPHRQFQPNQTASELVLPKLAEQYPAHFDFILIDGDHGWPAVMVDFCYALRMLAPDALLMIDDISIHSIKELARLLLEQPGFEKVLDLEKSIVFRRKGDFKSMPGWGLQPYISRRTNEDCAQNATFRHRLTHFLNSFSKTRDS